jgi:DNA-binding FadR family transcriptional regulator
VPLDPDDSRAPYLQVADALRAEIVSGRLAPGAQLPSRASLSATYGVAQMTVQSALRVLRDEGWIVSQQGRGVFVRHRPRASDRQALEDQVSRAFHVLNAIHGPISGGDLRCRECRDRHGQPVPFPCRTHIELSPELSFG